MKTKPFDFCALLGFCLSDIFSKEEISKIFLPPKHMSPYDVEFLNPKIKKDCNENDKPEDDIIVGLA